MIVNDPLTALGHAHHASHAMLLSAAGAVEVDINPLIVLVQFAMVTGLMLVLKPMLFDPLLSLFEKREQQVGGARKEAREMDDQAADLLRRYEKEIEKVTRVASQERDKLRAEAVRVETKELDEAKREIAGILEAGRAKVSAEEAALRAELGGGTAEIAQRMAARVLGREVS